MFSWLRRIFQKNDSSDLIRVRPDAPGRIDTSFPAFTEQEVRRIFLDHNVLDKVALLGVRGYRGRNQRNVFDDQVFLVGPSFFRAYCANTDPAVYRPRIANLVKGVWAYKLGTHGLSKPRSQQYEALVQAGPVTVLRDGAGLDTGFFGINIHRGGQNSVSSIGCQTIRADMWPDFIFNVKSQMRSCGMGVMEYCLIERE